MFLSHTIGPSDFQMFNVIMSELRANRNVPKLYWTPQIGIPSGEDIEPNTVFNINIKSSVFEIFESTYYIEVTMSDPQGKVEVREFILQDTMNGDQRSWVFIAKPKQN